MGRWSLCLGLLLSFWKARGQVDGILQQNEIYQVRKELQETMAQLDAIRHEIRAGMSIMHPGPLVREVLDGTSMPVQEKDSGIKNALGNVSTAEEVSSTVLQNEDQQGLSQCMVQVQSQATSYARLADTLSAGDLQSQMQVAKSSLRAPPGLQIQQGEVNTQGGEVVQVLPVSAVDAGLLPPRTGVALKGSDLVLESLVEGKVAHQALQFFQQPEPPA
eukprot:c28458_g1_i3 orf=272-925(+)